MIAREINRKQPHELFEINKKSDILGIPALPAGKLKNLDFLLDCVIMFDHPIPERALTPSVSMFTTQRGPKNGLDFTIPPVEMLRVRWSSSEWLRFLVFFFGLFSVPNLQPLSGGLLRMNSV